MKVSLPFVASFALLVLCAQAQENLIPNADFSDPKPLNTWRYDFPGQEFYAANAGYLSQTTIDGRHCAVVSLPPHVAENQGGKLETALIKVVPGASYHAEIEAKLMGFDAKVFAEAYVEDPRTEEEQKATEAKGVVISLNRIPADADHKQLIKVYRAQFPGFTASANSKAAAAGWTQSGKDFTVPMEWKVAGKKVIPAYIILKIVTIGGANAGKIYYTGAKLVQTKAPGAETAPKHGVVQ
jgi:hypothetical protein